MKENELLKVLYPVALAILLLVGISASVTIGGLLLTLIVFVIGLVVKNAKFRLAIILLTLLMLFVYL